MTAVSSLATQQKHGQFRSRRAHRGERPGRHADTAEGNQRPVPEVAVAQMNNPDPAQSAWTRTSDEPDAQISTVTGINTMSDTVTQLLESVRPNAIAAGGAVDRPQRPGAGNALTLGRERPGDGRPAKTGRRGGPTSHGAGQ